MTRASAEAVSGMRKRLAADEARAAALYASFSDPSYATMFSLIEVLGLEAALRLMLTMPGQTVRVPAASAMADGITMSYAAMAVVSGRMTARASALYHRVPASGLREACRRLREHTAGTARAARRTATAAVAREVRDMFDTLAAGDPHL